MAAVAAATTTTTTATTATVVASQLALLAVLVVGVARHRRHACAHAHVYVIIYAEMLYAEILASPALACSGVLSPCVRVRAIVLLRFRGRACCKHAER